MTKKTFGQRFATVWPMRPVLGLVLVLTLVSCQRPETPTSPAQISTPAPAAPADDTVRIPGIPVPPAGSSDWIKQAYQVQVMTPVDNHADSKAELSLAWTPAALLLHVHTNDMTPAENQPDTWNDSVEVFLASAPGSEDRIHFIFSPARSDKPPIPTFKINDKRVGPPAVVLPEFHTDKTDDGYAMTISIPWANFKHVPLAGETISLQIYVNDAQTTGKISRRIWYPEMINFDHADAMQHVRLASQAGAPQTAALWLQAGGIDETVRVSASAADVGRKIAVWADGKQVGEGPLEAGGPDGAAARVLLTGESTPQKDALLTVSMDGNPLPGVLKMPDMAKRHLDLIKKVPLVAASPIFGSPIFPTIDFRNREIVESAFGPYTLKVRFFDAKWNEVTVPKTPGRYGALVEFQGQNGLTFTRDITLFKTSRPYNFSKDPYSVTVKFPAAFGLSDLSSEQWNINAAAGDDLAESDNWAGVVAGLQDLAADPARWHGFNLRTINAIWWSELHKRLGENQDYPHLTKLPDDYDKDPKKAWPLLLFLHGSGERGTDLDKIKNQGPLGYINTGHPLPFIVVEPQCPLDQPWNAGRVNRLIDQTAAAYRVDPKRIYVTGLSMGGFGTLEYAATYPDRVAAIASLSGGNDPDLASRLKKVPTWLIHGDIDTVVPTTYSTDLYHAMQRLGAPVKLTVNPGVGHWGWDKTYADPALYAWLLQHSK